MENKVPMPTPQQAAEIADTDVRVCKRWLDALEVCTFHGRQAGEIAGLIAFLKDQHEQAKKRCDAAMDAIKTPTPQWTKPELQGAAK